MKLQGKALSSIVVAMLLASCGDPSSNQSLPKRLLSAFGGLDVIHYGYIDNLRYEAAIGPDDLHDSDTVESAMPPIDAVDLAKPALSAVGENPEDFVVCGVDLTPHPHRDRYFYLVALCSKDQPNSVGFRVPVLLSGQIIQPRVAEDQS
ncbi:MAG: hypothetical protein GQ577_01445 [Woeseiaceae bacterium]|nr:hypothetical protein [Woeseiaceae bacterium]